MDRRVAEDLDLLRTVVEGSRFLILVVDEEGRVIRVNRAVETLTGLTEAALRKPIWELATQPAERDLLQTNFGPRQGVHRLDEVLFHLVAAGGATPAVDWTVESISEPGKSRFYLLIGLDASNRLVADDRLRPTDQLRRLVLDRLPAVVWMTDRNLRFTFGAGGGLAALGLQTDELARLGTSLYSYFQTDDRAHPAIAAHLRALEGQPSHYQITWNERTYESRIESLRDEQQAIIGCIGISFDITERTRADRALADSEARLRRLVEANVIGIVFWDARGQITDANQAFLELVGYTREEFSSGTISWREITPPEYRLRDERALAELAATGRCTPFEKEYVAKNGQRVPVLVGAASFERAPDGGLSGVAFNLDLREQIRLRAARDQLLVREQNARLGTEVANSRLRLLLEASKRMARPMAIRETLGALAGLVVPALADWAYVAHRGYDGNEWIVASAHADPNQQALLSGLHDCRPDPDAPDGAPLAFRTGRVTVYDDITSERLAPVAPQWSIVGTRDPEHLRTIRELGMRSLMCVPIRGRVGVEAVAMLVSVSDPHRYGSADVLLAEDLAARVAVALENGRLLAESLEAIEARDAFLSVAAHELRTPLTALLLQIEMSRAALSHERLDVNAALRGINSTAVQARRLSALVDSLLEVGRLRTGGFAVRPEEMDIGQTVMDTVAMMTPDAQRVGCAIAVAVPGKVVGRWDRARIEQVLRNLLSNAMKFGAGRPIEVGVEATADAVEVRVRDHGMGLGREDQARIFGRFERAVSARHFGGLGLGLYISAQILRAHDGSLRVESEPGQGALFIIHLPRTGDHLEERER